ncbi:MlaD family protein [Nocardioides terrisoli]|uniref:MlaD family protein n=1 Tax=Nocardioides terrisoli TaxID=3388267 RepID=UPI00287B6BB6|nr:MlaD family protein [Nocardioides marmorisolisilvae]
MITGFRQILWKFLLFAAISLALLALLYNTMVNGVPGHTRNFTAEFTNVSGLATGDDVRVAGVRVGKVTDIGIVPGGAKVTFELQDDQPLLDNTHIVMRYQNLLGQRYLSLVQGARHGAPLAAGADVPRSRTSPGFDLTELLNGFRPLLDVLQPADVNKLATSIIQVLQGEGGSIEQLLAQTTRLTNFLADRDTIFGKVLTNLTPVLNDLSGQGSELKSTVHELRLLMTGLAKDRTSIGTSISGLSRLISSTSDLLAQSRRPLVTNTHMFRQVAQTLDDQKTQLTAALKSFGVAFGDLGRVSSYGNAVNVYLCTLWLKLGGPEVNLSGHQSGGPWTEACR